MLGKGVIAMTGTKAEAEARVDALLIEPLAGLKRGKDGKGRRLSPEGHEAMITRLRVWLSYLGEEQLCGLRDHIAAIASNGEWPSEAHIRNVAIIASPPPPEVSPYPRSMMKSALGRRAVAQGWGFEMYQEVKRHGPPPFVEGGWKEKQLREEAEKNQRRRQIIEENMAAGIATDAEAGWLRHWHHDMAEIAAIQAGQEGAAA